MKHNSIVTMLILVPMVIIWVTIQNLKKVYLSQQWKQVVMKKVF